jgi:hypothetical protein
LIPIEIEFGLDHCSSERRAEIHAPAHAAFAKLLETPPTTISGTRAIIEYLVAWDGGNVPEDSGEYLQTLLHSPIFHFPSSSSSGD